MKYVLDSCVALKWYLPEADSTLVTADNKQKRI